MCILFMHVNPRPLAGQFRLILASNRDEFYKRPSVPAHFWEEDPTVIGGRDMEPGKEGGSWLALSTRGRLATLLNVMTLAEHPPELLGRGSLVSGFVKGNQFGHPYLSSIAADSSKYRPFNFLTVQISSQNIDVWGYCNSGKDPKPVPITSEYFGIGNSLLEKPFVKVNAGVKRLKTIVEQYGKVEQKKELTDQLLSLLKCRKCHFPDTAMEERAPHMSLEGLKPFTSVFVEVLNRGYGTRAHSIILVDSQGQVDFSEWSLRQPIDPTNPHWEAKHYTCKLES
ncbi:transport and Golgi organization 2 homolog [Anabrus simplex]|uniref:transport and Golgi organization 2 homolog n=1 Tax=Anabrus simplex TaxID=316456 RepID=UPI0035A26E7C